MLSTKQLLWIKDNWTSLNELQKCLYLEQIKGHLEIKELMCLTELNELTTGGN